MGQPQSDLRNIVSLRQNPRIVEADHIIALCLKPGSLRVEELDYVYWRVSRSHVAEDVSEIVMKSIEKVLELRLQIID